MRQQQDGHNDDARGRRRTRVHAVQQLRVERKREHPWEEVETEQRFDKYWNTGMANCRKCGLEGLGICLHCLRISDRFSDRDKVLCCACIEENKKKKTTKYKSFWTNGMVHRLQQEEDELDRLEEEEKKRKLEVDMLNVVKAARDPNQKEKLAKQAFIAFKKKEEKKEEPNVKHEKKNEEKKKE